MKNIIIIVIALLVLIILFYLLRKKEKINFNFVSDEDYHLGDEDNNLYKVFNDIIEKYGYNVARNVEKIYRLETAHFTSDVYKNTGSAGMLAFSDNIPYGWTSLAEFWYNNSKYKPIGIYTKYLPGLEGPKRYDYLKFKNYGGFYSLAVFLSKYNNKPGRWYSTDPHLQEEYESRLENITLKYT